jgi:hypothetical protein
VYIVSVGMEKGIVRVKDILYYSVLTQSETHYPLYKTTSLKYTKNGLV